MMTALLPVFCKWSAAVQVATWLDAVLYNSSYRPVLLQEHVKDGRMILDHNNQVCGSLALLPS